MSIQPTKVILNAKGVAELVTLVSMARGVFTPGEDNPELIKLLDNLLEQLPNKKRLSFQSFLQIASVAYEEANDPTMKLNQAAWFERTEAKHGEESMPQLDMDAMLAAMFNMAAKKQAEYAKGR